MAMEVDLDALSAARETANANGHVDGGMRAGKAKYEFDPMRRKMHMPADLPGRKSNENESVGSEST